MRLSQAIREGSKGSYKADAMFNDGHGGMCALGAAMFAVGRMEKVYLSLQYSAGLVEPSEVFPILYTQVKCPKCDLYGPMRGIIPHLNNNNSRFVGIYNHDLSREEIADWVETQEIPAEITERENGEPPAVPAKEVWNYIGAPVEEPERILVGILSSIK